MRTKRWLHSTAHLVSNLLSPPAVAAFFGFAIAWSEHAFWPGLALGLAYAFFMCILPLAFVVYLVRTGRISDLHMSQAPRQRRLPYLAGVLCALAATLLFALTGASPRLADLALINLLALAALALINLFWLISNHTASIAAIAAFSALVFGLQTGVWSVPLVGLVVWSRWHLRKHTWPQMAVGLLVGIAPVVVLAWMGLLN